MANIKSPCLFFVTSPRTPFKMRPEIDLLVKKFAGQQWNANTDLQRAFMRELSKIPEFGGATSHDDPALSARDRINRAPKALGLVSLDSIALTPAGKRFLDDDLADEAILRQLLKFQLPSPFHKANPRIRKSFCIRPYLEILRLVYDLGRLAFDELQLFGMQLTDWHEFEATVEAVQKFRIEKERNKGRYKKFIAAKRAKVIMSLYDQEIKEGRIKTRESNKATLDKFIQTKVGNLRDYADACLRYLRATGLVTVSNPGRTISIIESRRDEVVHILKTVERDPVFVTDQKAYCLHLFDANTPVLLTDERKMLVKKAVACNAVGSTTAAKSMSASELKKRIKYAHEVQRKAIIDAQITDLKAFTKYDEVVSMYDEIRSKQAYDPPLMLEWNAWRTMTMMDGGDIRANLVFDDAGNPLSTAPGNNADIVCDYGNFTVTVEVTLMAGSKQYEAEGESVARHLGEIKVKSGKDAYCFFVAPTINPDAVVHFYTLHKENIRRYGGKSVIIPMTVEKFVSMLLQTKNCGYVPSPEKIRAFCEYSVVAANAAKDEEEWYAAISDKADHWLS